MAGKPMVDSNPAAAVVCSIVLLDIRIVISTFSQKYQLSGSELISRLFHVFTDATFFFYLKPIQKIRALTSFLKFLNL